MGMFDLVEQKEIQLPIAEGSYTKPESVKLSEDLEVKYSSLAKPFFEQVVKDRAFYNGAQWKQRDYDWLISKKQMPLVVNVIRQAVEQAKAMLTANHPSFVATAKEDSDVKKATGFSILVSDIWEQNYANLLLKQLVQNYYVDSVGWMFLYYNPQEDNNEGRLCFDVIDTVSVLPDPTSRDIFCRDADHILISVTSTSEQVQQQWIQFKSLFPYMTSVAFDENKVKSDRIGDQRQGDVYAIRDQDHINYKVIHRYTKVKEARHKIVDVNTLYEYVLNNDEFVEFKNRVAYVRTDSDGSNPITAKQEVEEAGKLMQATNGVWHFIAVRNNPQLQLVPGPVPEISQGMQQQFLNGEIDELPVENSEVRLTETNMGAFIESGILSYTPILTTRILYVLTIGGVLCYEGVLPDPVSEYPIIPTFANFSKSPFNYSHIRGVRGIQEYINKLYSLIIAHASNSTNVKVIVPRGSQNIPELEAKMQQSGTAIIEADYELGTPVILAPIPLPNELYANVERAKQEIYEHLGIYPLMQGSAKDAPYTYKGTLALDEYGQRRIKSMKEDIEGALVQLGRVVIQMIQAYYTEYKVVRILQPNNLEVSVALNSRKAGVGDDLSKVHYAIEDASVGRYDLTVVSGSTLPSNRWALSEYYMQMYEKGIIDQVEMLKKTEVVDTEGVLERMGMIKQLQQALQASQNEIKMLKGDLQTAQRETVHARQMMEVNKFEMELEKLKARSSAAVELFGARLNDERKVTSRKFKGGKGNA